MTLPPPNFVGAWKQMPMAVGRPDNRLADVVPATGHPVVPVHPHALKLCRDAYVTLGAKPDIGDAEVSAE